MYDRTQVGSMIIGASRESKIGTIVTADFLRQDDSLVATQPFYVMRAASREEWIKYWEAPEDAPVYPYYYEVSTD